MKQVTKTSELVEGMRVRVELNDDEAFEGVITITPCGRAVALNDTYSGWCPDGVDKKGFRFGWNLSTDHGDLFEAYAIHILDDQPQPSTTRRRPEVIDLGREIDGVVYKPGYFDGQTAKTQRRALQNLRDAVKAKAAMLRRYESLAKKNGWKERVG
jgi:hypothetical protein